MSDENKGAPAAPAKTEDLGNIKAEFNRKLSNLEASNAQLQQQLASMLQATKPAATTTTAKLEDVWFDKPEQAAARIKAEAKDEMRAEIQAQNQAAAKTNATIGALMQDFPELNDANNELTRKAVEIYGSFSAEDKSSPVAYRAAVREAAMELGIKPASKRKTETDDETFSLGGNSAPAPKAAIGKGKVDAATLEFARIMGLDTSNPKVKENLTKRAGRNFGRYE